MDGFEGILSKKKLGQVFLINKGVADAEAAHAEGKVVIEIGPGMGMLTRALCMDAKKVIAVEKDFRLYTILKHELPLKNLVLINKDFLRATDEELELEKADIVISNIPYYLSSSVVGWLAERKMQAVLCLQKEFVEHMLAKPDTRSYSKLSVFTSLLFRVTKIMDVPKGNFRPIPKVDSAVIYMKPLDSAISKRELEIIGLMMQHKKKTVRNAILDSHAYLGMEKGELSGIAEKVQQSGRRVFKLPPGEILRIAKDLESMLRESQTSA
ncbi:MAG: 16S rRNA (adenine(1518)-N(6)/adenine(1519)-N(6))-dimethyltransferase RsmA [Candidatus Micrarchaeaceae archaeon]